MSVRTDLATAASSVADVTVTAYYRQSLRPGHGFVKWNGHTPSRNGFGYMASWQVWIAVPQDVKAAEQWVEAHLTPLLEALADELTITAAQPLEFLLDAQPVNGLVITGARGADF